MNSYEDVEKGIATLPDVDAEILSKAKELISACVKSEEMVAILVTLPITNSSYFLMACPESAEGSENPERFPNFFLYACSDYLFSTTKGKIFLEHEGKPLLFSEENK